MRAGRKPKNGQRMVQTCFSVTKEQKHWLIKKHGMGWQDFVRSLISKSIEENRLLKESKMKKINKDAK